jgi:hypothetical protein
VLFLEILPDNLAAAFQQNGITPDPMMPAYFFANANDAEAARPMQSDAGLVFGEHNRLQHPQTMALRASDQFLQQLLANTLTTGSAGDVDADLGDSRVNGTF